MTEKTIWMRPNQVEIIRTNDQKQMLGKYLPKRVMRTWTEDFVDEDTGKVISVDRFEVVAEAGKIDHEKLQQIQFAIQSGDLDGVDVCERDFREVKLFSLSFLTNWMVEIPRYIDGKIVKTHIAVRAQDVSQAIIIAVEFGQMYKGFEGDFRATRVVHLDAKIVPDDHACIPEKDRVPAEDDKDYFKVQVRTEWIEDEKPQKHDKYYIVAAKEVGEAKERIARLIDIIRAEETEGGKITDYNTRTIRKAIPFEVDFIVPKEYSELYRVNP